METDIINQVHPVLSPNLGLVNSDVVVQYLGFSGGNIFSLLDDPNNRLDATHLKNSCHMIWKLKDWTKIITT
jgi:hypothetical protein